jgi:hypothetical protein
MYDNINYRTFERKQKKKNNKNFISSPVQQQQKQQNDRPKIHTKPTLDIRQRQRVNSMHTRTHSQKIHPDRLTRRWPQGSKIK